jgi:tRNA pseudouridine38-40 synthase
MRVVADGFLPQMVRNMTAAVVAVAQGDRTPDWIDEVLAAQDRSAIGEAAPPQGLTLLRVGYASDAYQPDAFGFQAAMEG